MKQKKNAKRKPRYIISHEYTGKTSMRTAFEQLVAQGVHVQSGDAPPSNDTS